MKKYQPENKQSDQAIYIANNLVGAENAFGNFIAGSCNQIARATALAIIYHLLFILNVIVENGRFIFFI
ncbi:MAG: hypothetical protein ACOYNC_13635 [Bacteroidales bacterium]